jgi:hypothetical protein
VIEVFVCRGFSGQIVRLRLPTCVPVEQLMEQLCYELQFWVDPETLGLYNLTQDFEYRRTETLAQCGTQPGDLLLLAQGTGCRR